MKTKEELLGDLIFYLVIAIICIACIFFVPLIAAIVLILVISVIVAIVVYAFFYIIFEIIRRCISYLFISHKENIAGKVVSLRMIPRQLFVVNIVNERLNYFTNVPPIFITDYFLKIKNGIMWYTVKVPENVFLKVQNDIKNGIKNISLDCEKYDYDKIYNIPLSI